MFFSLSRGSNKDYDISRKVFSNVKKTLIKVDNWNDDEILKADEGMLYDSNPFLD